MFFVKMFQIPQMFLLEMFQIPQMFIFLIGMRITFSQKKNTDKLNLSGQICPACYNALIIRSL